MALPRSLDRLARRWVRQGLQRGLLKGESRYLVLGAAALVVRLMLRPEAPRIVREELQLGETLVVRHAPAPPTRRQRRKAAASGA